MKLRKLGPFFVLFIGCVALIIGIWTYSMANATRRIPVSEETERLKNISINLNEFQSYSFSPKNDGVLKYSEVLVVYLLESCPNCQTELQIINSLISNGSLKVPVVGIMGESEIVAKEYVRKHQISFPILFDESRRFAADNKIVYYPANFLVKDGKVNKVLLGTPSSEFELLEFVK